MVASRCLLHPSDGFRFASTILWFFLCLAVSQIAAYRVAQAQELGGGARRPNILWITCEDTGPQLGCYGDQYAQTPRIDRFAQSALRFNRCWSNAPVCAPARTTLIAGIYPTSYGAQPMRSSVPLPEGFKTLPERLREAGYYCSNNNKEDYNFYSPGSDSQESSTSARMWDDSSKKAHWKNRSDGQSFFAVFNFTVTHEGQIRKRPYQPKHDPALAPIPPYHPDTSEVRLDWAQYYDRITEMDTMVGQVLDELRADGLEESTIVFFFGDHGCGLPRGKRWLYESGLRVPMLVHIPAKFAGRYTHVDGQYAQEVDASDRRFGEYREGGQSDRLVSFVDLAPTVLGLCGIEVPSEGLGALHGRSFFVEQSQANEFLIGFRDRMDERLDCSRAIRNDRFMYIRNFVPDRPQGAYLNYMFQTTTTREWFRLFRAGDLDHIQSSFWRPKPVEEFYDTQADPHQVMNLARTTDVRLQRIRDDLASRLKSHMLAVGDCGAIPEGWLSHRQPPDRSEAIEAAWKSGNELLALESVLQGNALSVAQKDAFEQLKLMLQSSRATHRYWGGLAARRLAQLGQATPLGESLLNLLNDPVLEIRGVVAEGVFLMEQSGEKKGERADKALEVLVEIVEQPQASWGARILALNALCDIGASESMVLRVQSAFEKDGGKWKRGLPSRYHEYAERLVQRLASLEPLQ